MLKRTGSKIGAHTSRSEEGGEGHSLGSDLVAENLDGVKSLEGSPTDRVRDLEDVDPGENSLADGR